jgi:hypothetical protein
MLPSKNYPTFRKEKNFRLICIGFLKKGSLLVPTCWNDYSLFQKQEFGMQCFESVKSGGNYESGIGKGNSNSIWPKEAQKPLQNGTAFCYLSDNPGGNFFSDFFHPAMVVLEPTILNTGQGVVKLGRQFAHFPISQGLGMVTIGELTHR